jgi:hypothetical protein
MPAAARARKVRPIGNGGVMVDVLAKTDLGERYASAVAAKDENALREVLTDPIDFGGLTPGGVWAGDNVADVLEILFEHWFDSGDHIDRLVEVSTSEVAGRRHLSYLLEVTNSAGLHLVEQQVYFNVTDERISWMRVLCSGYRPITEPVRT